MSSVQTGEWAGDDLGQGLLPFDAQDASEGVLGGQFTIASFDSRAELDKRSRDRGSRRDAAQQVSPPDADQLHETSHRKDAP